MRRLFYETNRIGISSWEIDKVANPYIFTFWGLQSITGAIMEQLKANYLLEVFCVKLVLFLFVPALCLSDNSNAGTNGQSLIDSVKPGQRLRIKAPDISPSRIVGRVDSIKADTIFLVARQGAKNPYIRRIPIASIVNCEVSIGRKTNARQGALYGLIVGSVLGGVKSLIGDDDSYDMAEGPAAIPILGGLGCIFGAVFGTIAKTDRWQEITSDKISFKIMPSKDKSVQVSVSFAL
ncbi:MAG: hypothetical protein ABIE07_04505 [Candidatus Zixiibacteriota bacterium]